jgi:hypothetical protein
MYKLKITFSISFMVLSVIALSQGPKFIYFDGSSDEIYSKEDGSGNTNSEKLFQKSLVNGHSKFFIKGELFMVLNHKNIEILNENNLKNTNFSSIDKLKIKVQKENGYYPYKVYPDIFLIEKVSENKYQKFKVKWVYHIE